MAAQVVVFDDDEARRRDVADEIAGMEAKIGSEADVRAAERMPMSRAISAKNLRLAGATFAEIAEVLSLDSAAQARVVVEKQLAAALDDDSNKDLLRQQMSLTLDAFIKSVYPKATDAKNPDQLAYLSAAYKIADRKIKLHGLDSPQVTPKGPSDDQLQQLARVVAVANGMQDVIEGDPFDNVEMEYDEATDEWKPVPSE